MSSPRDIRIDSDNDIVIGPFFDTLGVKFADPQLSCELHERHQQLCHENRPRTDSAGPAETNTAVAMALLAAEQVLRERLPDRTQRHRLLEQALVEPLHEPARSATVTALDAADDPFAMMVATTHEREKHSFGARFVFAHPVDTDSEFISDVRHCFFHELLTASGAGHLTSILCAFDATWMGAVDPARHGFTVDRTRTIATGGGSCPFRFRRVDPDSTS